MATWRVRSYNEDNTDFSGYLGTARLFYQATQLGFAEPTPNFADPKAGLRFRMVGPVGGGSPRQRIIGFDDPSTQTNLVWISWERDTSTTGHLSVWLGRGTLLGATGTVQEYPVAGAATLNTGTYYYLEATAHIAETPNGSVSLFVNGSFYGSVSGVETNNTEHQPNPPALPHNYTTQVSIGGGGFFLGGSGVSFDAEDLYIPLDSIVGPVHIRTCYPISPGFYSQWIPKTTLHGTVLTGEENYREVDDLLGKNEPSNFWGVEGGTNGAKDTYHVSPSGLASVTDIVSVRHWFNNVDSSGTYKPLVRIGSVDYLGPDMVAASSQSVQEYYWDLSPATSSLWTLPEAEGAEYGFQKSGGGDIFMASTGVELVTRGPVLAEYARMDSLAMEVLYRLVIPPRRSTSYGTIVD